MTSEKTDEVRRAGFDKTAQADRANAFAEPKTADGAVGAGKRTGAKTADGAVGVGKRTGAKIADDAGTAGAGIPAGKSEKSVSPTAGGDRGMGGARYAERLCAGCEKRGEGELPFCTDDVVHGCAVAKRRAGMPDVETLYDLSDFFKIFGDSTRLSILFAIDGEPLCVCDIADLLGMTKSAVSHQLRILRDSDLITYRRSGKNVFYSLADDHVRDIIEKALEHIRE